jgi:hypothetical protein
MVGILDTEFAKARFAWGGESGHQNLGKRGSSGTKGERERERLPCCFSLRAWRAMRSAASGFVQAPGSAPAVHATRRVCAETSASACRACGQLCSPRRRECGMTPVSHGPPIALIKARGSGNTDFRRGHVGHRTGLPSRCGTNITRGVVTLVVPPWVGGKMHTFDALKHARLASRP